MCKTALQSSLSSTVVNLLQLVLMCTVQYPATHLATNRMHNFQPHPCSLFTLSENAITFEKLYCLSRKRTGLDGCVSYGNL